ncbi:hypothetical protein CCP3SC5AM1_980004 [Gammaproteobacteria bacterium]
MALAMGEESGNLTSDFSLCTYATLTMFRVIRLKVLVARKSLYFYPKKAPFIPHKRNVGGITISHGQNVVAETRESGDPDGFILKTPWL